MLLHWQSHSRHHRVEHVCFVFEVPIDGATCRTSALRDVLQTRPADETDAQQRPVNCAVWPVRLPRFVGPINFFA